MVSSLLHGLNVTFPCTRKKIETVCYTCKLGFIVDEKLICSKKAKKVTVSEVKCESYSKEKWENYCKKAKKKKVTAKTKTKKKNIKAKKVTGIKGREKNYNKAKKIEKVKKS